MHCDKIYASLKALAITTANAIDESISFVKKLQPMVVHYLVIRI